MHDFTQGNKNIFENESNKKFQKYMLFKLTQEEL